MILCRTWCSLQYSTKHPGTDKGEIKKTLKNWEEEGDAQLKEGL